MSILLTILKVIGLILLCILSFLLILLLTVLFVPVRYLVKGVRKAPDFEPVDLQLKVSWLLQILSVHYHYPKPGYFIIRLFGLKIYTTDPDKPIKTKKKRKRKNSEKETVPEAETVLTHETAVTQENAVTEESAPEEENTTTEGPVGDEDTSEAYSVASESIETESVEAESEEADEEPTLKKFFQKLIDILQNIRYTFQKIYDNIKEILHNIKYYTEMIQSDSFQNAFRYSKNELWKLIKKLIPGKIKANLLVGTGDPASTGNILAIHGILYPLIGNHVVITPDFENKILEGDFLVKGKITLFRILITALRIYFHKDIRRLLKEFKKGGSKNG